MYIYLFQHSKILTFTLLQFLFGNEQPTFRLKLQVVKLLLYRFAFSLKLIVFYFYSISNELLYSKPKSY